MRISDSGEETNVTFLIFSAVYFVVLLTIKAFHYITMFSFFYIFIIGMKVISPFFLNGVFSVPTP